MPQQKRIVIPERFIEALAAITTSVFNGVSLLGPHARLLLILVALALVDSRKITHANLQIESGLGNALYRDCSSLFLRSLAP